MQYINRVGQKNSTHKLSKILKWVDGANRHFLSTLSGGLMHACPPHVSALILCEKKVQLFTMQRVPTPPPFSCRCILMRCVHHPKSPATMMPGVSESNVAEVRAPANLPFIWFRFVGFRASGPVRKFLMSHMIIVESWTRRCSTTTTMHVTHNSSPHSAYTIVV